MNEYDSELVKSILFNAGYRFADNEEKADIILLNTCSVRDSATRKVFGQIYEFRHELGRRPIIGILGCMATDAKQSLFKNKKLGIDLICGPDSYRRLPEIIQQAQNEIKIADIELSKNENYDGISPIRGSFSGNPSALPQDDFSHPRKVNAWVAITRGCNNFCTFCIVPYARGRERSRSVASILQEIKKLVRDGYPQVTLLGQNVNSYKDGKTDFPLLLDKISQIKGLKRIRFMSPHPKDLSLRLIDLIAERPNICKHVHLPLQSGSSRILKLMNRCYTKNDYLALVDRLRAKCPQVALTTDVIVGFPTEKEKDFKDTLSVIKKVRFDSAFIFKYSPRNGTVAARKFTDDVRPEEKTKRIVFLNELQRQIALEENQKLIGSIQEVLIEERYENGWRGRCDNNKIVSIPDGKYHVGEFIKVEITHASVNGLSGISLASAKPSSD